MRVLEALRFVALQAEHGLGWLLRDDGPIVPLLDDVTSQASLVQCSVDILSFVMINVALDAPRLGINIWMLGCAARPRKRQNRSH